MTTANYDQAVPYYDQTRGYRAGVTDRLRAEVRQRVSARSGTRFLELGIGTGLIGVPFLLAGDDYIGVDMSHGMLRCIAPKLPDSMAPGVAQADISHSLPFPARSFDVALAVRVFHLLGDWRRCISEARRVLMPGGHLLIVEMRTPKDSATEPPWAIVQAKWNEILQSLGVDGASIRHGNGLTESMTLSHLRAIGGDADIIDLLTIKELPVSCRTMVERRARRMFSNDWALPDEIHQAAIQALQAWLDEDCAHADEPFERRMVFRAVLARF